MAGLVWASCMCPGSPEGKIYPRVFQTQHHQQVKYVIILLYWVLVQPYLECHVQFWAPQFNKDVKVLCYNGNKAEARAGRNCCKEQLNTAFVCLEKRRLRERRQWDLIVPHSFPRRGGEEGVADLVSLLSRDRTCRNDSTQQQEGLGWTSGNISLLKGCSSTGTSFLERWLMC